MIIFFCPLPWRRGLAAASARDPGRADNGSRQSKPGESMDDDDIEPKVIAYAKEFLRSYTDTVYNNFPGELQQISELGMKATYFPLLARRLGEDTSIAVLFTSSDFYMFFLADCDRIMARLEDMDSNPAFSSDWTRSTPAEMRIMQVRDVLGISTNSILRVHRNSECVNAPGTDFVWHPVKSMIDDAQIHGIDFGNQAGQWAEADLPDLLRESERRSTQASFSERYAALVESDMSPSRGGRSLRRSGERCWSPQLASEEDSDPR
jgi:hypothetical protein